MNISGSYKKIAFILSLPIIALIVKSCASPGPLSGGEKDIDPPIFMASDPPQFSKNTQPKKIFLEFDEFLVLEDLNSNLLFSPPLNEEPDIKLKGRKVVIKNHKDLILDENTTYTYYFGNAICDLHESNPITNFEYVFSTGPTLDSLSVRGTLLNAQYLTAEEGVYVCLYKNHINDTISFDSLPYFVKPYYVARTNELGEYQLNNLRKDDYLIFAVQDMNSNYYFDMPNEKIAFLDSLTSPQDVYDFIPDSIPINTEYKELMDSLWKYHSVSVIQTPVDLFLFLQDDSIPKLLETKVTEHKKIDFYFKFPIRDSIHFKLLNDSTDMPWHKKEFSKNKDTLTLWLTRIPHDSLFIQYQIDTIQADTLEMMVRPKLAKKPKKKRFRSKDKGEKKKEEKKVLEYTTNIKNSLAYYQNIKIAFETPLKYANFEYAILIEDSVAVESNIYFSDSIHRKISIEYPWQQETKYKLVLPQESLIDIFNLENDSIIFNFTTTSDDDYSKIILNLSFDSCQFFPLLISLVKGDADKEKIIQQHRIMGDTLLSIHHVSEGDYMIKAMEDFNDNGHWNTGHYGKKLAPETIYYYQKRLTTKAGWDNEEKWHLTISDRIRPESIKVKDDGNKKKAL